MSVHRSGASTDTLETMLLIDGHTALPSSCLFRLARGELAPHPAPVLSATSRREGSVMGVPTAMGRATAALRLS